MEGRTNKRLSVKKRKKKRNAETSIKYTCIWIPKRVDFNIKNSWYNIE